MPEKSVLRREMQRQRRTLSAETVAEYGILIARELRKTKEYRDASSIYLYLSCKNEVSTREILRCALQDGKKIAAPRVQGSVMEFYEIRGMEDTVRGTFGIAEPKPTAPLATDETALMLVPGLAFDRSGNRLGYGGGFYDRYLHLHPNHPTIGLCYPFQVVETLDAQPHDMPVGRVLVV